MKEMKRIRLLGLLFLSVGLLTEVLMAYAVERGTLVLQHYACPVFFAFAGMTLLTGLYRRQKDLLVGVGFAAWYALSRVLLRELYLDQSFVIFCDLCSAFLLCFPFARTMDDAQKKQGLKIAAVVFLVAYGLLAWISILGAMTGENIILPYLGTELGTEPKSKRLYAGCNPNMSACMFMVALMLGLWLIVRGHKRWIPLVLLMGAGLYAGISLTASRTVMVQMGCLAAGIALIACLRLPLSAWKRWTIGLIAALACLVLVVCSFTWVAEGASDLSRRMIAVAETTEKAEETGVRVRDMTKNLFNLNGRFKVYATVELMLKEDPTILLTGMTESALSQRLMKRHSMWHTHNAYLQTLMTMGLPGLLMAVWFTVRALWVSVRVIFSRRAAFADQMLALILPVLLLGTFSEPYLFREFLTVCNMTFFLVFGYVLETERALRA